MQLLKPSAFIPKSPYLYDVMCFNSRQYLSLLLSLCLSDVKMRSWLSEHVNFDIILIVGCSFVCIFQDNTFAVCKF